MKYGRVLTYKDAEEAKKLIGKKVIRSDNLRAITETPETRCVLVLKSIDFKSDYPFETRDGHFQFIREVIEEEPELMTNRQLMEWIIKGNGEYSDTTDSRMAYSFYCYPKSKQYYPVLDNIRIRTWDSDKWVVPTVDIYERDCKGKNS